MPYYDIVDALPPPYNSGTFTRINAQYATVTTSGTNETDLYTYTIPANTLINNGDGLNIQFTALMTDNAVNHITRYWLDGTNQHTATLTAAQPYTFNVRVVKISTTEAINITEILNGDPTVQIANSLDFTAPIQIKFTGECPTTGTIQTYLMTVDLQKT